MGGFTRALTKMGVLNIVLQDGETKKILAYAFNTPVGSAEKVLLLSLRSTWNNKIDLMCHVEQPLSGNVPPLRFRDGIHDEYKEDIPEHIKEVKCINQKLFSSFDTKIKNVSKPAIDLARETPAKSMPAERQ